MKKLLTIMLIIMFSVTLVGCKGNDDPDPIYDNVIFDMFGDADVYVTQGDQFFDFGIIAKDSGVDITEFVTIDNPVDTNFTGEYTITYTLDYHDQVTILYRTVHVLSLNAGCELIEDTTTMECYKNWSSYLHTVVTVKIYFDQTEDINSIEVFEEMEEIISLYHKLSDKYDTYEGYTNIKTINDDPTATHTLLPELYDLVEFTLEKQADVDNLFNMALGPVLQIWHDYRENCNINQVCEVPPMQDLLDAQVYTDPQDIVLDSENSTITMGANMSLDLGGISKGYISGILIEYLDSLNLSGYLLNNGESNISIGGTHPTREGGQFLLAVTDPTYSLPYYATIYLNDGDQLVTSGDYQQYYIANETLYHHVIHNESLMPERYTRSVSIIFDDPGLADLYSTAIFIMTVTEGQEFVNNTEGLEAIWYGLDGTIYFSENFETLYLHDTYE